MTIDPATNTITGYWGKVNYRMHFVVEFNHAFQSYGTYNEGTLSPGNASTGAPAENIGTFVTFNMGSDSVVQVRIGLSFVSLANARANLAAEIPQATTFAQLRQQARDEWNTYLRTIAVEQTGASREDLVKFYSMYYNMLRQPTLASDINRQYWGADDALHVAAAGHAAYQTISTWDTGRGFWPLLACLFPKVVSDAMQSILDRTLQRPDQSLPGFLMPFYERGCSEGFGGNVLAIQAQSHAFGARDFDAASALTILKREMITGNNGYYFMPFGYDPIETNGGSITGTVEHCFGSAATAMMALSINPADTVGKRMLQNSANWYHMFHDNAVDNGIRGFLWTRNQQGRFSNWVSSTNATGSSTTGWHCSEASTTQMTWFVPQNLPALIGAMGGAGTFVSRLDKFFAKFTYTGGNFDQDSTSRYMSVGNETDMQAPWSYNWAGAPHRTQDVVRRIITTVFDTTIHGVPGNDDWGGMDGWYVSMALGLYPMVPGVGGFAISGPQFSQFVITRENGTTITILGANASNTNRYIQTATLNGRAWNSPWVPFDSLVNGSAGTTLSFTMGPSASTWGSAPTVCPPPGVGPTPVKVDDSHADISYRGTWTTAAGSADNFGGSARRSTTAGDTVRFTFTGTAVTWFSELRSDGGKADVAVDGTTFGAIDSYSAQNLGGIKAFTRSGLSFGQHTLRISVRSDRNAASSGNVVTVDAFASMPIAEVSVATVAPRAARAATNGALVRVERAAPVLRVSMQTLPGALSGVTGEVFDAAGRQVCRLVPEGGVRTDGTVGLVPVARSTKLAAGTYVLRVKAGSVTRSVQVTVRD